MLGATRRVIGSPSLLRSVHGLVQAAAVTDVLPDGVYEGFAEGTETVHRWDLPQDAGDVVVLAPPGRAALAVVRSLRHLPVAVRFLDDGTREVYDAAGGHGAPGEPPRPAARVQGAAPTEAESYQRLRAAVDLSHLAPLSRAVTERIVHVTGEVAWADDLLLREAALARGLVALRAGRPIVVDEAMVAAGITTAETVCGLQEDAVERLADARGTTRAAEGLRVALRATGGGAVVVVGGTGAALEALLDASADPALVPALAIGVPAGWTGAREAKAALWASGLPALTNRSRAGGPAAAVAALEALLQRTGIDTVPGPGPARGGDDG